ncbi:multidrug resistance protein EbrA [Oceanobacillus limi]|uniref:Multidrug resistance protein EbrA n=1 Tax=Oceanobacillus limi TaxID=930131 RepID=A0A1I0F7Z5_9BACI|nr:multidrug efflux SMR transporter [Oceanobacillus limi]SET54220.1 multidrug resistance protein EbrA [Oceanobacillus limi]
MNAYFLLGLSVVSEVIAISMLKASNGFKNIIPTMGVIIGYTLAFYALSISLKTIPIGTAYAIWAGLATALTALVSITVYKENYNSKKSLGFILIIGGVILLNIEGVH